MAEMLVRVVDKIGADVYKNAQCTKRGDVIVAQADGWGWGTQEQVNPHYRIVKLPGDALPTDRESVFYLNVREIPPKTDVQNAIQIALHSKIKLFYRPKGVQPQQDEDVSLPMTLRLDATHHKLVFYNPTPYHVTVVELAAGEEKKVLKFDAVMVEPKATAEVDFTGALPATLYVSHMNDWGGQNAVKYTCDASTCRSVQP